MMIAYRSNSAAGSYLLIADTPHYWGVDSWYPCGDIMCFFSVECMGLLFSGVCLWMSLIAITIVVR